MSCQPGELPGATILEDIVGQFGEDDGQEEDLENDDDGHVVDAGLDGAEGVVVERNKEWQLKIYLFYHFCCYTYYFSHFHLQKQ